MGLSHPLSPCIHFANAVETTKRRASASGRTLEGRLKSCVTEVSLVRMWRLRTVVHTHSAD